MISTGKRNLGRVGLVALGLVACLVRAGVAVTCGGTVTGSEKLTANLDCPANNPVVTIDGGTLDMAGYTISGNGGTCVHMAGRGARLKNGTISGCANGIVAGGQGAHKITAVIVRNHDSVGLWVGGDGNVIKLTAAVNNGTYGFLVGGDRNRIESCSVALNGSSGIQVSGDDNTLTKSEAISNGVNGFSVNGGKNKITGNVSVDNTGVGISVTGIGNKLTDNRAEKNSDRGFMVTGESSALTGNLAVANGNGSGDPGFQVSGGKSRLLKNVSVGNTGEGFRLYGDQLNVRQCMAAANLNEGFRLVTGTGFVLDGNRSHGNSSPGILLEVGAVNGVVRKNFGIGNATTDGRDLNANCGGTQWAQNVFGLVTPSCVQ